jgi:hypothetical protein
VVLVESDATAVTDVHETSEEPADE